MSNSASNGLIPTQITIRQKSRCLLLLYSAADESEFTGEFLRVFSPSAEVVGHGPGQRVNPVGKQNVEIKRVEPVGNYAIKIVFSDGHDTGIYSWKYLRWLEKNKESLWANYIEETEDASNSSKKSKEAVKHGLHVPKERI